MEWLEDNPFPRALVREIDVDPVTAEDRQLLETAKTSFAQLLELGHRLGRLEMVPKSEWATDIDDASWQLAGRSPCTALDQYSVLAAPTRATRLTRIDELLREVYTDLELMGGLDSSG